jgi:hypothetical protein
LVDLKSVKGGVQKENQSLRRSKPRRIVVAASTLAKPSTPAPQPLARHAPSTAPPMMKFNTMSMANVREFEAYRAVSKRELFCRSCNYSLLYVCV